MDLFSVFQFREPNPEIGWMQIKIIASYFSETKNQIQLADLSITK